MLEVPAAGCAAAWVAFDEYSSRAISCPAALPAGRQHQRQPAQKCRHASRSYSDSGAVLGGGGSLSRRLEAGLCRRNPKGRCSCLSNYCLVINTSSSSSSSESYSKSHPRPVTDMQARNGLVARTLIIQNMFALLETNFISPISRSAGLTK